jgi:radical SAM superfamily enzyme YgiQ (UPF0313 family)
MKGSTKESDMNTVKFAMDVPSDTLQFSICIPFPGTKLYDWAKNSGYLVIKDWKDINVKNYNCTIDLPGYNHKEVEEVYKTAIKLWHRKMLFKRPDIIIFHLYNLYKYQGLTGMLKVATKSVRKLR